MEINSFLGSKHINSMLHLYVSMQVFLLIFITVKKQINNSFF